MSTKKKRILFESHEHTSNARIAGFLRELADRVESGRVVLRKGNEEVTVDLPDSLVLEVSLDEKEKKKAARGPKRSLEVEIEWYEGDDRGPLTLG